MRDKIYVLVLNYRSWQDTVICLESLLRSDDPDYQVVVIDNSSGDGSAECIVRWLEGDLTPPFVESDPLGSLFTPPLKKKIPFIRYAAEEAENGGDEKREKALERQMRDRYAKGDERAVKGRIKRGEHSPGLNSVNVYNKSGPPETAPTSRHPVILIQSDSNRGYAGGNNIGIRYALKKGDFSALWVLNNDTVVEADSLRLLRERAAQLRSSNRRVGIIGSKVLYYDSPDIIQSVGGRYNRWLAVPRHIGEGEPDRGQYDDTAHHIDYVPGVAMLLLGEFIDEVGIMNEEYFLFFEELDLAARGARRGWGLDICTGSRVYHKEGRSTGSNVNPKRRSYLSEFYQLRNRSVFTGNYYRRYLPSVYFGYLLSLLNGMMRGQFYRFRIIYDIIRGARP